ncbi:hypothetical protein TSUD_179310, partial [Trifolium subterraneum]
MASSVLDEVHCMFHSLRPFSVHSSQIAMVKDKVDQTGAESFDRGDMTQLLEAGRFLPIRKSQGAAVGALVHMLKKAAPLHQDFSSCENLSQGTRPETRRSNEVQEPNQILETLTQASIMSS